MGSCLSPEDQNQIKSYVITIPIWQKQGLSREDILAHLESLGIHRDVGEVIYREGNRLNLIWTRQKEGMFCLFSAAVIISLSLGISIYSCAQAHREGGGHYVFFTGFIALGLGVLFKAVASFAAAATIRPDAMKNAVKNAEKLLMMLEEEGQLGQS